MKEQVEFRKIREFGELISDTFLFIRQNFKPLMKVFFTICGLFLVAGILSMIVQTLRVQEITTSYPATGSFSGRFSALMYSWQYVLVIIFALLNYVSMSVSILSYVVLYVQKGNVAPRIEEVWAYFRYYFFRVFWGVLFIGLAFGVAVAVCVLIGTGLAPLLGVLCFLLFMVGVLYTFPILTLFFPVMIMENGSFWYALGRGFKLLKGEWWMTAIVLFIIYVIFYLASFIIQVPVFFVKILSTITHTETLSKDVYAVFSAIVTYLAQVFAIIPLVASALIYFNLVERKESTGLMDRIGGLGQDLTNHHAVPEEY